MPYFDTRYESQFEVPMRLDVERGGWVAGDPPQPIPGWCDFQISAGETDRLVETGQPVTLQPTSPIIDPPMVCYPRPPTEAMARELWINDDIPIEHYEAMLTVALARDDDE